MAQCDDPVIKAWLEKAAEKIESQREALKAARDAFDHGMISMDGFLLFGPDGIEAINLAADKINAALGEQK